jgi:NAD(P)-dependent dehydrogenase (short-subunit alcohol dehydrogenase family)
MANPRTAIITGAASGIGRAAVAEAVAAGWKVAAVDLALPAAPKGAGADNFIALACDVSQADACAKAVADAVARFGRIDTLLHFAAVHSTETWDALDADVFNRTLAVNVTGSFLMAQAAAGWMKDHGGGAIVLTGSGSISVSGLGGHGRGGPAYVSSKAAIIGLTRALARSLAPFAIRVNAVSPGATDTAMTAEYSPEARANVGSRTLAGRMGEPEEIARAAMFLASDDASYITGEMLNANGGGSFG